MSYIPERGDIVTLNFNTQKGSEQAGHRPAIVISPKAYNRATGLVIVCPITNKQKGYAYEVKLPATSPVTGVILSDQLKSMDIKAISVKLKEALSSNEDLQIVIEECLAKIKTLVN
ncbi:type II toxin-antitoxin system PemK/MazF family toxin [Bacillus sp. FJAT-22090]|uniref:type II toxin-antitoxin system PemK/MazF family toxin n=1 Tax=Bacillus sp. FJAT-22090 TaxID=1581038 RepID=UPI0011A26167|nr:type II toxin-antitoxin system PemK/MazF family toxin [Bacillus sp. FJAT-22090]